MQGLRGVADGHYALRLAGAGIEAQREGMALADAGKTAYALTKGGLQCRQEGRIVQCQQPLAGGRTHAPDQRVAIVLRQQGQWPFIGEALEGAMGNRLVGMDMGDHAQLLVVALQGFLLLLTEDAPFGLDHQWRMQHAALLEGDGDAGVVFLDCHRLGRLQQIQTERGEAGGQGAIDLAITNHIAQRRQVIVLAVQQRAAEVATARDMDLFDDGGGWADGAPGAQFVEDLAAAIGEGEGARIGGGILGCLHVDQRDARGSQSTLRQQDGDTLADGATATDDEVEIDGLHDAGVRQAGNSGRPHCNGAPCAGLDPAQGEPRSSLAHQGFDPVHGIGHTGGQQFAAGGGDVGVILDADADVPELLRHAFGRTHVDARFDGQHHARLQRAPGLVALGIDGVAVVAHVVYVHAQPVAGAVHVELAIVALLDDVLQRADLVCVEQAGVQHALRQHLDGGVVAIHEALARGSLGDGGVLRGQHDFIERILRAAEPAVGREGAGDVGGVAVQFAAGIDQHQVALPDLGVAGTVVQHAAVGAGGDDGTVGRVLRAVTAEFMQQFGFQMVFAQAGAADTHGAAMGFGGDDAGTLHDVDLEGILEQAHVIQQHAHIDDRAGRGHAAACQCAHALQPALQLRIALVVLAQCVIHGGGIGEQGGHALVEFLDRVGSIQGEELLGSLRAMAVTVPDLAFQVLVATEQDAAVFLAGHQHQHRLGFGEAGQVVEVAVMAIRIVGIAVAHHLGRGRDDGYAATGFLQAGDQARAARGERSGVEAHGRFPCVGWFRASSCSMVPTLCHTPRQTSPPTWPRAAYSRSSGPSLACWPGVMPSNICGRQTPMLAKVSLDSPSLAMAKLFSAKSPSGWKGGFLTRYSQAMSRWSAGSGLPHGSSSSSTVSNSAQSKCGHQMSPERAMKGSSPSRWRAWAMPPAVSSAVPSAEYCRRAPQRLPSPRVSSIIWPRWAWLMTISVMPARTSERICQTINGRPRTLSKGLGQVSVSGRMRSPRPAAKIMAFMVGASEGVAELGRVFLLQLLDQAHQRCESHIAARGLEGVFHDQRQVLQVAVLAIAMPQAGEDAQHLEVALQAHPLEVAVEGIDVGRDRQAGAAGLFPVADGPVQHHFLVPLDVGVAQQRDQVIGDGAVDRILEIDDARIALGQHHQVARMVVAMDIDLRLRHDVGQDGIEGLVQHRILFIGEGYAQVLADIPLAEQFQLAQQQGTVIFGQGLGLALRLQKYQGVDRIHVQCVRAIGAQLREVGGRAQVREQQEAAFGILGQDIGDGHAGLGEQAGHLHEGTDVLLGWRGIHHDDGAASRCVHPEIPAETGVGRGRAQGGGQYRCIDQGVEPGMQFGKTEIRGGTR
eukprot:TRINITY_DN881_c1_g1_i15.p1 TRINITY_DN881_c1_g1~~TRINITY_DN881_c1_g1_i15.p1  ORF type:complete len:1351 (-),score=485.80 TRINITY_DN881_c1_g1_i15:36729-40781(-)